LAEAFGIVPSDKPPTYSELLINSAKALPVFVKNLESQLSKFIRSADHQVKIPPVDNVQRQIIVELAKYYFLETELIGFEPNRQVVLHKRAGSRMPLIFLSQVVQMQASLPSPAHISSEKVKEHGGVHIKSSPAQPTMSTLHLYNLSRAVKTSHLESYLRAYEGQYVLQWIDESNALAIFHQHDRYLSAVGSLVDQAYIRVKPYRDTNPQANEEGNVVLGATPPPKYIPPGARPQPEKTEKPEKPIQSEKPKEDDDFKVVTSGAKRKVEPPKEVYQSENIFSALVPGHKPVAKEPASTPQKKAWGPSAKVETKETSSQQDWAILKTDPVKSVQEGTEISKGVVIVPEKKVEEIVEEEKTPLDIVVQENRSEVPIETVVEKSDS